MQGRDCRRLSGAQCAAAVAARWVAAHNRDNPDRPAAPFAVNQIVHRSNDRLEADLSTCAKWRVPGSGQGIGVIDKVEPVAARVDRLEREYRAARG